MDTLNHDTRNAASAETEAVHRRRIAWEAARIAEARASAAAGRIVPSEAVDAWIDSLDNGHALPAPRSGP